MFKAKYLFFRPVRKNTEIENIKKIISIKRPLVDGPSNMDLSISDPIALENKRENCCIEYHKVGIVCTRIKNKA